MHAFVLSDVPNLLLVIAMPICLLLVLFLVTWGVYTILGTPFHPTDAPKEKPKHT